MSLLQAILMGVIQGVTEFLPVSSSGHLALFQKLFGVNTDTGILFEVLLHIGTLLAVFVVYYHDIVKMVTETLGMVHDIFVNLSIYTKNHSVRNKRPYLRIVRNSYRKIVVMILVSSVPTAIIGVVSSELVEMASELALIPGIGLIVTAVILFFADRVPEGTKLPKRVTYTNAFMIGICQGIATLPGISRSGTTVTACLVSGFKRGFAVKYSFLMSIPAILGSLLLQLKDLNSLQMSGAQITNYVAGMFVAAIVGYICIKTMLVVVRRKKFTFFSAYCMVVGIISVGAYFYLG